MLGMRSRGLHRIIENALQQSNALYRRYLKINIVNSAEKPLAAAENQGIAPRRRRGN